MKLLTLLLLLTSASAFAASGSGNVSQVITLDGPGTTSAPFSTSLTDFKTNYTNYVTLGSGFNSATAGNNYYFTSGNPNGTAAYSVPTGKTLVVYAVAWQMGSAGGFGIGSGSSAVTEDNSTLPFGSVGTLGWAPGTTSGVWSLMATAANVTGRMNAVIQFQAGAFPYLHANSSTAISVLMEGIYVP